MVNEILSISEVLNILSVSIETVWWSPTASKSDSDVNDPSNSKQTACEQVEEASTNLTHIKPVYAKYPQEDAK